MKNNPLRTDFDFEKFKNSTVVQNVPLIGRNHLYRYTCCSGPHLWTTPQFSGQNESRYHMQ